MWTDRIIEGHIDPDTTRLCPVTQLSVRIVLLGLYAESTWNCICIPSVYLAVWGEGIEDYNRSLKRNITNLDVSRRLLPRRNISAYTHNHKYIHMHIMGGWWKGLIGLWSRLSRYFQIWASLRRATSLLTMQCTVKRGRAAHNKRNYCCCLNFSSVQKGIHRHHQAME